MADRNDALEDYKAGLSYKEIADKHNVSESTVKSWAARYWNNDKTIKATRKRAKKLQLNKKHKSCNQKEGTKKKKPIFRGGAPPGNQNCKGHQNALKHGAYSLVNWDCLSDDEKEIVESISTDEEEQLIEQLALYTIRERRILKAINTIRSKNSEQVVTNSHVSNTSGDFGDSTNKSVQMENIELTISRLDRELTSVQRNKTTVINSLAELRRNNNSNSDDWLNDFFSAIDEVDDESQE